MSGRRLWQSCMCVEETYVALWTRRSIFNASEKKIESGKLERGRKKMRLAHDAQRDLAAQLAADCQA